jgi:hypothetical protein
MNDSNKEVLSLLEKVLSNQAIQGEQITSLNKKLEDFEVQKIKDKTLTLENEIWGSDPNKSTGLKGDILKLKADKKTLYNKIDNLIASENRRAGIVIAINFLVVALGVIATIMTILKN